MIMSGKVLSINISQKKGIAKEPMEEGLFIEDHGIKGDAHAGRTHRQVSLLAQESIDKMKKIGVKGLCSGKFAENITTQGIILHEIPLGTRIQIGTTVQEVTQIGKECHNECAIKIQAGSCIMPTEGIFTRVVKGGRVKVGDIIEVLL